MCYLWHCVSEQASVIKKNSATWLDCQFSQCFISVFCLIDLQYRNVSCIFVNCNINFPWFQDLDITDSHLFSVVTDV